MKFAVLDIECRHRLSYRPTQHTRPAKLLSIVYGGEEEEGGCRTVALHVDYYCCRLKAQPSSAGGRVKSM